jgi:hypothetical protein
MLSCASLYKFGGFRYRPQVAQPHHPSPGLGQPKEVRQVLQGHISPVPVVQAKLAGVQAVDPCEEEADRVADQVVNTQAFPGGPCPGAVCPDTAAGDRDGGAQAADFRAHSELPGVGSTRSAAMAAPAGLVPVHSPAAAHQIRALRQGRPLSDAERDYFETRMGQDFSQVRLHTENAAADAARSIDARAFTHGSHIAFAHGEYGRNGSGRHLLAHELAHVIQQARSRQVPAVQRQPMNRCSAREPENCPTYEQWLLAFRTLPTFISREGSLLPGSPQAHFEVLGGGPASREATVPTASRPPTPTGRRLLGERFIDHPTDDWVQHNLPENLRRTAYQLPADCADILVILRHVYLSAHRRRETYGGWGVGDIQGRAAQGRIRGVIREAYSGNLERVVNPYSDSRGNPIRDFARLEGLLHPGDQLVWDHHRNGLDRPRTGGHSQTIMDIQRDASGGIDQLRLLQGNQPIGESLVRGIVEELNQERQRAGQRPLSARQVARMRRREGPLRSAAGRRIEVSTMRRNRMVDVELPRRRGSARQPVRVWSWNDPDHTILEAAGPPRATSRPAMRRVAGARARRISDWFRALSGAGLIRLHGIFEAALHEVRSIIDGGQAVSAADAGTLGTSAGSRLWHFAREAVSRFAGFGRSRGDLRRGDLGDRVHFDRLHRIRAMIRALGGIEPPGYQGNPQAAGNVRTTFAVIDRDFNRSARGGDDIRLNRRVPRGGELVKLLVTGFDPFHAAFVRTSPASVRPPPRPGEWNPSGAAVMAMDGTTVNLDGRNRAAVEGLVMPVSAGQFDEGIVEEVVRRAGSALDGVITVSVDPNLASSAPVTIEQFAVGVRDPGSIQPHRMFPIERPRVPGLVAVPGGGPAILETGVDVGAIAQATAGRTRRGLPTVQQPTIDRGLALRFAGLGDARRAVAALGLGQSVASALVVISDERALRDIMRSMSRITTPQGVSPDISFSVSGQRFRAAVVRGPGGSFLSNEIAYRAQRELGGPSGRATSFHVHTPGGGLIPQETGTREERRNRTRALGAARGVLNLLIETLRRMLRALGRQILSRRAQSRQSGQHSGGGP